MKCRNNCSRGRIRIPFGNGWRICPVCAGKGRIYRNQRPKPKDKQKA